MSDTMSRPILENIQSLIQWVLEVRWR